MKERYRAHSAPWRALRILGSLATLAPVGALALEPHGAVRVVVVGLGALGVGTQIALALPGDIVIGDDGVLLRGIGRRIFVAKRALASVHQTGGRLQILEKSGASHEITLWSASSIPRVRGLLAQLAVAGEGASAAHAPRVTALHDKLAARARAFAAGRDETAAPREGAYRTDEPDEHLWEIAEDADASPLARAGALLAIRPADDGARARAQRVADGAAHPIVAEAFDAAARGNDARIRRAIAHGLRGSLAAGVESDGAVASDEGGESAGNAPGILRTARVLHVLAFLARGWPLLPILALVTQSLALGIAGAVGAVVGGMPWAFVRDYDPLVRFEAGDLAEENGHLVVAGRRVLDLSEVKHAYVHHRAGAPPVVRFEGTAGWVLLDAQVGGPRAARAFLARLPLREEQRTTSFSTMQTAKWWPTTAAVFLAASSLALVVAKNALPGYAIAALLALPLALIGMPRFVIPTRDGLVIRALVGTRFVAYDDIVDVERRRGAGVVVLRGGERIPLRAVNGELTRVADDDLTEAVIDRWTESRVMKKEGRGRVRVAGEGRAKAEAEEEAKAEEEEEAKAEAEAEEEAKAEAEAEEEAKAEAEAEEEARKKISGA